MNKILPHWSTIHTIIFDFDGVFTDNSVIVASNGLEHVVCSRLDGLGLDILRNYSNDVSWKLTTFVLSTEKNPVVAARCSKLKLDCVQGVSDKQSYIQQYLHQNNISSEGSKFILAKILMTLKHF